MAISCGDDDNDNRDDHQGNDQDDHQGNDRDDHICPVTMAMIRMITARTEVRAALRCQGELQARSCGNDDDHYYHDDDNEDQVWPH